MRDPALWALLDRMGGEVVIGCAETKEALRHGGYVRCKKRLDGVVILRCLYKDLLTPDEKLQQALNEGLEDGETDS